MEIVSFIIGNDRSSTFLIFVPGTWTVILVAPDLLSDSIEHAIGVRDGPVKHKPNTTYAQNRLPTVGCFQSLLSNFTNNANPAYPTYLWCFGFFLGRLRSCMELDGVHNLGTRSLVCTVA